SDTRKQAAWEVIKYLSSGQATVDWTLGSGYVPSTKTARESPEITELAAEDPNYQVAIDQLDIARDPDIARRYVPEMIQEAKDSNRPSRGFVRKMNREWEKNNQWQRC